MRTIRLYCPFESPHANMKVSLTPGVIHHALNVLRLPNGSAVEVFNGNGLAWAGQLEIFNKKSAQVVLQEAIERNVESPLTIHLVQGVAKGDRMDVVMQKATELGVSDITPVMTERSHVKLDAERWAKKMDHWQQIIVGACEQSGRNTLPRLHPVVSLIDFFSTLDDSHTRLILSPYADTALKSMQTPNGVTLLIGPEGGLSEKEVDLATNRYDFQSIVMGPRVLRTETAALTAIALLQHQFGDV